MKRSTKKKFKKITGIGNKNINIIYNEIGLNPRIFQVVVKPKQDRAVNYLIKRMSFNKTLKIKIRKIINFYINIKTYKGLRHQSKQPVRGQRTHTNAKTVKKLAKFIAVSAGQPTKNNYEKKKSISTKAKKK